MSDESTKAYLDEVAPFPRLPEQATAHSMTVSALAQAGRDFASLWDHFYLQAPPGDKQAARDFAMLSTRAQLGFDVAFLLREFARVAPEEADEAARKLWLYATDGETTHELTGEWLVEYGVDPERIQPDPVERHPGVMSS
jgi:hypothetical protein